MTIRPVRSFAFIATVSLGVSASTVMLAGCDSTPSRSAGDPASAAVESDTPEGLLVSLKVAARESLTPFPWRDGRYAGLTFHEAPAAEAAKFMYDATKVDGVWDQLPEKLRGVYWCAADRDPPICQ